MIDGHHTSGLQCERGEDNPLLRGGHRDEPAARVVHLEGTEKLDLHLELLLSALSSGCRPVATRGVHATDSKRFDPDIMDEPGSTKGQNVVISRKVAVGSIIAMVLAVLGGGAGVANAEPPGPCYGSTKTVIIDKGKIGNLLWAEVMNCARTGKFTIEVSRTVDPVCRTIGNNKIAKFESYSHLDGEIKGVKKC
ncbi:hypothetical protein [Saccharothrix deserti]|uniref:hypothetical protein n=1 Tax=Saccharothrix deserti TaxID=2593674 RepID=UPI001EE4263D|nr:hypothetical protein [Saccharothrix deserti]